MPQTHAAYPIPHPPHEGRQPETTGDKTTSEPKKPTTPTNTRPLHEGRHPETMGDNGRQDHFRAQEADHTNQHPSRSREKSGDNGRQDHFRAPHQPPPTPHMKGDNRRQWETTGDKTTSEPKKPTTPTNTHPTQPETTGDNGRQDHFRAQDGGHTNHPPPPT